VVVISINYPAESTFFLQREHKRRERERERERKPAGIQKRIIRKRRIVVYRTQRIVSLRDDDGIDGIDDGDDKEEAY